MLPIILMLYDLLLIQDLNRKNMGNALKRLAFPTTVVLIFGFALIWLHYSGTQAMFKDYRLFSFTLTERLLTAPRILLFYISVLLYPIQSRIALVYDIQTSQSLLEPLQTTLPFLTVAGLIVLGIFLICRRRHLMAFCIFFFFLNHVPEGTIVPLHLAFLHRNYLPSLLFFLPIAILLFRVIQYFSYSRRIQYGFVIALGIVLACHGSTTFSLNRIWKTEEILWRDNIKKTPGLSLPHNNLGNALFVAERYDEALTHFQEAWKLNRHEVLTLMSLYKLNVARVYLAKNEKTDQAIDLLHQVINEEAYVEDACHTMAVALLRKGQYRNALVYSQKAVELSPDDFDSNLRYALVLLKNDRLETAIGVARRTLRLQVNDGRPFAIMGEAFRRKKNYKRAIFFWEQFQNNHPMNAEGIFALIGLYDGYVRMEKAAVQVRRLLHLSRETDLKKFVESFNADAGVQVYVPDPGSLMVIIRNITIHMLGSTSED